MCPGLEPEKAPVRPWPLGKLNEKIVFPVRLTPVSGMFGMVFIFSIVQYPDVDIRTTVQFGL